MKTETHRRTAEEKQNVQTRMAAVDDELRRRGYDLARPWWMIAEDLLAALEEVDVLLLRIDYARKHGANAEEARDLDKQIERLVADIQGA